MKVKQRFPWVSVSAVAAVLVVGVVAWLQIPVAPIATPPGKPMPVLGFTRLDPGASAAVLSEQLAAYDPTPLFLPTAMNSSQISLLSDEQTNADGPFANLQPRLVFNKEKADITFMPVVRVPKGPVQGLAMADRREVPLALGRVDDAGEQLASRVGYLEATRAGDNRVVLALSLSETSVRPQGDWQPMELLGAVSRLGLVGGLVVSVSSGSDTVDEYFISRLTDSVRVGKRLPPGFYSFRIGP